MSFTNKTPNYDLPQYVATDKPTYLVDSNGAYLAIDTAMKANETAAATAQSTADTNTAAIGTLNTQINGENGLATDLTAVKTLAATTAGSVNTINSLIGNGEPTTTDKTLIGAINEINNKIPHPLNYLENKYFQIIANGVKTVAEILNELHAEMTTYITNKGAKCRFRFAEIKIGNVITLGPREIKLNSAGSNLTCHFQAIATPAANKTEIYNASLASNSFIEISTNGTVSNYGDTVLTEGTAVILIIEEYELD